MIAITGASGQIGRLVIRHLLTTLPANHIVALARRPESLKELAAQGVHVRQADYDNASQWPIVLQGIRKLLLISSSEIGKRVVQHQNVIQGALRAGVERIAYTSLLHADNSPLALADEHRQTEKLLNDSGLDVTLLRNGWYTENYLAQIPAALQSSTIIGCAADGKISAAPRNDYAAAAATLLLRDGKQHQIWELAGDESWTLADLAHEVSRQSGIAIRYQQMSQQSFSAALVSAGLPQAMAEILANSDSGASQDGLYDDSHQLSRVLERTTETLAQSVKKEPVHKFV